jgi:hypothetical protein
MKRCKNENWSNRGGRCERKRGHKGKHRMTVRWETYKPMVGVTFAPVVSDAILEELRPYQVLRPYLSPRRENA